MIGLLDRLARPFLHALDPEDAHGLAIKMLKFAPLPPAPRDDKRLALRVFGLNFPNPVGIAAGFDKNAEVPDALLRLASASSKSAPSRRCRSPAIRGRGCSGSMPTTA